MPAPEVDDVDYELLASFRYALRRFLRFSEDAAYAAGLTPQQHQGLMAIRGFSPPGQITMSDLAERLQVRHQSAVGLVDRLEQRGLLERRTTPEDRRRVNLVVTTEGLALLNRLTAAHQAELQRIGPELHSLLTELIGAPPERKRKRAAEAGAPPSSLADMLIHAIPGLGDLPHATGREPADE